MNEAKVKTDKSPDLHVVYHAPWSAPKFEESLDSEKRRILRGKIKELRGLKPNIIFFHLAVDWIIIFTSIFVSIHFLPWQLYIFPLVIIASRQHALLVIMHDAVHFTFLKNHKVADFVTNVLAAYPIFITTENFRYTHLLHHRFLNSERDPDLNVKKERASEWLFPKTKNQIIKLMAKETFGGGFFEILRKLKRFSIKNSHTKEGKPNSNIYLRVAYYACSFTLL